MMRILLVEDDRRVATVMASMLRRRGYQVEQAASVSAALGAAPCDLVLLDLNLPDGDGLDVCRRLRSRDPHLAIIAVTARGEERDRVTGLRMGADDYVVKPFSMAELQARIEALLRRTAQSAPAPESLRLGRLWLDFATREVRVDGRAVTLTRKEFDILASLARQRGAARTNGSCSTSGSRSGPGGTLWRCMWPRCARNSATPAWSAPYVGSATVCTRSDGGGMTERVCADGW
jgi:DNA-binding response OmpR family regulator